MNPDANEPSPERQAELRADYARNTAPFNSSHTYPPYANVAIHTYGEVLWICRERGWLLGDTEAASEQQVDFSWANLPRINLSGVNLSGADFSAADMSDAILTRATLCEVSFYRTHLNRADLREADLRDALLIGADLKGANMEGANLAGADL